MTTTSAATAAVAATGKVIASPVRSRDRHDPQVARFFAPDPIGLLISSDPTKLPRIHRNFRGDDRRAICKKETTKEKRVEYDEIRTGNLRSNTLWAGAKIGEVRSRLHCRSFGSYQRKNVEQ